MNVTIQVDISDFDEQDILELTKAIGIISEINKRKASREGS